MVPLIIQNLALLLVVKEPVPTMVVRLNHKPQSNNLDNHKEVDLQEIEFEDQDLD